MEPLVCEVSFSQQHSRGQWFKSVLSKTRRLILLANHQQQEIKLSLQIMKAWQKHVFSPLDPFIMFPGIKTKTCILPALSLFLEELEFCCPEFWEDDFAVKGHRVLCRPLVALWKGQEEKSALSHVAQGGMPASWSWRSTCWGSPVNNPVKQKKKKTEAELESLCWKKRKWKYFAKLCGTAKPTNYLRLPPTAGLGKCILC